MYIKINSEILATKIFEYTATIKTKFQYCFNFKCLDHPLNVHT